MRDIKRFVNQKFLYTVDLELLRRFLTRYESTLNGKLAQLTEPGPGVRDRLLYYFLSADESYPPQMLDELHQISELSTEVGARLLCQRTEMSGIALIPPDDIGNGIHLNPRYLALRTFLDHPDVFASAVDWLAFLDSAAPAEFVGTESGVQARVTKRAVRAFEKQASEFFNARHQGSYCKVRWYPDNDGVNVLIAHGKEPVTTLVIEEDQERPLTFREMRQDAVTYDGHTGRLKVSARTDGERRRLSEVFAETVLRRPGFFAHEDARNLYTLAPIALQGPAFSLNGHWDPDLIGSTVTEIQVRPPKAGGWSVTVRDSYDAIRQLFAQCPGLDLRSVEIGHVKLRYAFLLAGRKRRKTVKIQPPSIVSFNRTSLERKVMEHLKSNGFCLA